MKHTFLSFLLIAALAFSINSCKKSTEQQQQSQLDANVQQSNADQNNTQSESDQADNDINNHINSNSSLSGRLEQSAGAALLWFYC